MFAIIEVIELLTEITSWSVNWERGKGDRDTDVGGPSSPRCSRVTVDSLVQLIYTVYWMNTSNQKIFHQRKKCHQFHRPRLCYCSAANK